MRSSSKSCSHGHDACTGSAGCKFAGADTKADAMRLAAIHDDRFELDRPINIHFTGCHHSCAQHYIGDIGLIGCKVEIGDELVEGYHVHLGGGWNEQQGIARLLFESDAVDELPNLITCLLDGYLNQREINETFSDLVRRSSDSEF